MAFSFLPKEDHYFSLFSEMTGKIQEAAGLLVELLKGSDENFDALSKKIKSVEHECDEITHNVTTKLNKSFITHGAVSHLKTAKGMEQNLLDIQRLENDADEIYFRAMAALFKNSDAVNIIKWKELYEILENGTDRCESVGNIIESIVQKHN